MLTFGSLFAGIGGIDLGLERAGMSCQWQVEIDDYATKVLTKHWPDVRRFRDVRECGAHNLAPVDLIAGGFPCQDISKAGRGAGINGERSGLWREFARIISELRPRYVLVENVATLLARGMGTVLGDLAACGYDAEWESIPAASLGAPHIRERIFIVAHARRQRNECRGAPIHLDRTAQARQGAKEERERVRNAVSDSGTDVSDTTGARLERRGVYRTTPNRVEWDAEPIVCRVAHGVPFGMDRLRGLGNAVVPQVAEFIGRQIVAFDAAQERL
jgi:DNA (cytosine-5)-methyltransferase 1